MYSEMYFFLKMNFRLHNLGFDFGLCNWKVKNMKTLQTFLTFFTARYFGITKFMGWNF